MVRYSTPPNARRKKREKGSPATGEVMGEKWVSGGNITY